MIKYEVKVYPDGDKEWFLNGQRHREDGPAIEWSDGTKRWFLNDKSMSEDEHKRATEIIDGVREYEGRIEELKGKLANGFDITMEIEELKGKLAKAMEHVADHSNDPHLVEWANATLAELKGQK